MLMKQIICCLILIGVAASRATIPQLYTFNNGAFTSDYSITYSNPVKPDRPYFGVPSEAGDINNDGIPDLLFSSSAQEKTKGVVYVVYGKKGSLRQFNSMDDFQPSDGFIIKGPAIEDGKFGYYLSAAGDINGDGIDDIVIGSLYSSGSAVVYQTKVAYVLFGRKSSSEFPSVVELDRLSSTQGFKMTGTIQKSGLNYFPVSGLGDVNGDGISDIIIGSYAASVGSAFVVFGSKQGFTDMTLPPPSGKGFTVSGESLNDAFGTSVSKIGDFNGDGVNDFIIGAPDANDKKGKAFLFFGRREGFPDKVSSEWMRSGEGIKIIGTNTYDRFGYTVRNAGDFNGDGLQDVLIGADGYNGKSNLGAAYVIFGRRDNPDVLNVNELNSYRGFSVLSNDNLKISASLGGGRDINGDGKSDIIIGAPAKWTSYAGWVYILYGNQASSFPNILLDNLQPNQGFAMSEKSYDFGRFVGMLKDVNGDGLDDFFVGSPQGNGEKGAAYLFSLPWSCPAQCLSCSKPESCDIWECPRDCKKCSAPNICSEWNCIDKCTKCSSPTTCDVWRCPDNCTPCKQPDVCEACLSGFAFIKDKCDICHNSETHFMKNGYCFERLDKWGPIKNFFGSIFY